MTEWLGLGTRRSGSPFWCVRRRTSLFRPVTREREREKKREGVCKSDVSLSFFELSSMSSGSDILWSSCRRAWSLIFIGYVHRIACFLSPVVLGVRYKQCVFRIVFKCIGCVACFSIICSQRFDDNGLKNCSARDLMKRRIEKDRGGQKRTI